MNKTATEQLDIHVRRRYKPLRMTNAELLSGVISITGTVAYRFYGSKHEKFSQRFLDFP